MVSLAAILGLAGTAASGIMSALNNRRAEQEDKAESARREAHYVAQAAENPLSRSDNRALIGQYDRGAQKQIETARSFGAIKGATPEYAAAVQKGVAEGRANLMSNISATQSARADKANELAEAARQERADHEAQRRAARNETYAALAANAANAFGSLVDAGISGGESNSSASAATEAPTYETPQQQGTQVQTKQAPASLSGEIEKMNAALADRGDKLKQLNVRPISAPTQGVQVGTGASLSGEAQKRNAGLGVAHPQRTVPQAGTMVSVGSAPSAAEQTIKQGQIDPSYYSAAALQDAERRRRMTGLAK